MNVINYDIIGVFFCTFIDLDCLIIKNQTMLILPISHSLQLTIQTLPETAALPVRILLVVGLLGFNMINIKFILTFNL